MKIRPAQRADIPTLGKLGAMMVQMHHDLDPLRFIAPRPGTEQGYGGYLGSQLQAPDSVVLVAEDDGKVLGYAFGHVDDYDYPSLRGPAGIVEDILVDPAHRGRGIGEQLLHALLDELTKRGVPRVVLSTAERNEAAQKLFAKAGFRRTMVEMTRESPKGSS